MYERSAATWHTLIDLGVACGQFLPASIQDLEYAKSPDSTLLPGPLPASALYSVSKVRR